MQPLPRSRTARVCRASSAARSASSPTISCAASSRAFPPRVHDDLGVPDLYLMFTDTVLVFDNVRQTLKIIANVPVEEFASTRAAYRSARAKIDETDRAPARGRRSPPCLEGAAQSRRRRGRRSPRTRRARATWRWSMRPRSTSRPATSSRWCRRSASRRRSTAHPFNLYRSLRTINPVALHVLPAAWAITRWSARRRK